MLTNPRRTDLIMDLGETWSFQITCHDDADGTILTNLSGASITIAIANLAGVTIIEQPGVILNPPTAGVALVQVSPLQQTTAAIAPGRFTYTIRVVRYDMTVSDQAFGNLMIRGTEF